MSTDWEPLQANHWANMDIKEWHDIKETFNSAPTGKALGVQVYEDQHMALYALYADEDF